MKKLNLDISLEGITLGAEEQKKTPVEISTSIIENVILNYGGQNRGLDEKERKQYYKITDAFEKVVKDKAVEVDLDDDWVGFIRKAFKESKLIPNLLLRRVEDNIEAIRDR